MKPEVWLVEDDPLQQKFMREFLESRVRVRVMDRGEEVLEALKERVPDVLLLDYRLPGLSGLDVLKAVRKMVPELPVIVITAYGRVEDAVEAMREGAFYYLTKPVDFDTLEGLLERALQHRRLVEERNRLKRLLEQTPVEGVALSPPMQEVLRLVRKVAPTDATVLITGESGTGKEWVARLIHSLSPRREGPFVPVHIAALPESLVEAELLGYEKGAFTDARERRIGKLEAAHGGTLFLDEIGELAPAVQVKLLRFLQDRQVERLGGKHPVTVDVRVVAATNRNLEKQVEEGRFREDLFFRLNVVRIHLPPLRDRREDILPLARYFLKRYARKYGKDVVDLDREAVASLLNHDFPGNVRELQNLIERAVVMAEDRVIHREDLGIPPGPSEPRSLDDRLQAYERELILEALREAGGVQTRAAEMLGLSERALRYRMKRLGLENPFRSPS